MVTKANNEDKYSLNNLSIWTIAQSVSMIPLVKDRVSIHPNDNPHNPTIQAFIIFHVMFKLLGVNAFQKLTLAHNMASTARKAMYHHFELITKVMKNMIRVLTYWKPQELEAGGGPYLCGDQYTLADISMV